MHWAKKLLFWLTVAFIATALAPSPVRGYGDRPGTDIVMDAPWRTMRGYVPVLFFLPQFEGGRRIETPDLAICYTPATDIYHG